MKKVFVLVGILLISAGMLFAAITSVGNSETFEVNLKLSSGDDVFTPAYKVGFTTDGTTVTADSSVSEAGSLDLTDSTNDNSLIATGTVYVYYQILSNEAVYLTLSGEELKADGVDPINWTGEWYAKASDEEVNTETTLSSADTYGAKTVYTHTPSVATGSYGSIPVNITTEDASGKAAKDYSATLTLTITAGTPPAAGGEG